MKKKAWVALFFLALVSDLLCIQLQLNDFRMITKPLLTLLLLGYFISNVRLLESTSKWWIIAALCLSWLGDVLLLFEGRAAIFFILGLSSFLLAHVGYILFFNKVRSQEGASMNLLFFLFVLIYYAALIRVLSPKLGDMKIPVWVYGLVISLMLWLALHLHKVFRRNAGLLMLIGALLFVLSDSILAVNKFHHSFAYAGIAIMLTYGLAQLLITEGSIRWLKAKYPATN